MITMERPFSRKARAKVNTDLTVEITDLAWTITNAGLAGDYLNTFFIRAPSLIALQLYWR